MFVILSASEGFHRCTMFEILRYAQNDNVFFRRSTLISARS